MRLPVPNELWESFLTHMAACPIGEASCSTCQDLLHQWGDAEQLWSRVDAQIASLRDAELEALEAPLRLVRGEDLPDYGERSL